jgi:hypothetical protein
MQRPSRRSLAAAAIALAAPLLALAAAGCQEGWGIRVKPRTSAVVRITRKVELARQADILFVIDNSGSMEEEQMNLGANFETFINVVKGSVNDYQIGVITTDVNTCQGEVQCLCRAGGAGDLAGGGKLFSAPGVPRILKPPGQPGGPRDQGELVDWFRRNVAVGIQGCGFEQGLEATRLALTAPVVNGYNEGFLRPDAVLVIVIVADENDCSHPPNALPLDRPDECVRSPTSERLFAPDEYVRFFRTVKGNPTKVALASVVGAIFQDRQGNVITQFDPDAPPDQDTVRGHDCETDPTTGAPVKPPTADCNPEGGGACSGARYADVVQCFSARRDRDECKHTCELTDDRGRTNVVDCNRDPNDACECPPGLVDSVCRSNFAATMLALGRFVVEQTAFCLGEVPRCFDPLCRGEIIVRQSGTDTPQCNDPAVADDCWEYVPPQGGTCPQINFRGASRPVQGSNLEIVFVVDPQDPNAGQFSPDGGPAGP